MVDEVFLQRAVTIRRTYLKVSNNLDFYFKRANGIVKSLDDILLKISKIQEEVSDEKNKNDRATAEKAAAELNKIIGELEVEGKRLQESIDPLNREIEKLALEEQELYRQIKEKNSTLTEEQIVSSVRKRLEDENLS
jgi:predicted  nucleic acid-binding Zn-ribbon protein